MVVIDGIILKGRCVVMPESFKKTGIRTAPPKSHGNRKN